MKTKETSTRQIYITVVTSGLTMLANKVARVLQPNEDIFDACSELANEIAKENGLEWSNVLVQYFNYYSDEIPAMALKVPSKPKSITWWNNLSHNIRQMLCNRHIAFAEMQGRMQNTLTGREIEEIWLKETQDVPEHLKPNQKQSIDKPQSKEIKAALDIKYNQKQLNVTNCGNKNCQNGVINGIRPKICKKCNPTNAKQFKTFDESLFKAYIDKFSDEDLYKAHNILTALRLERNK